ncbi:hypothetical protein E2A64_08375 [Pseudohoeflea suaedae]|uniref:Tat pathway signal protein n=1 Tax=Pseudohoeflea suaedae TaxID=877384 RepID=A0A4R5PPP5_9HYPH|nr:hypothetical protein [Pseudohoeflea suaedae]TDH39084.1 hypothetical protein E2A64_08375 [Pseudohoeflea suaedae]
MAGKSGLASALAAAVMLSAPVMSANAAPEASVDIELNRLEQNGEACRMTFVTRNGLSADLESSGFEMVVFDAKGLVKMMTVFDFGALPAGKTVVRRFDLPDTGCESVSRILVNGAARCKGAGIEAADCAKALKTKNLTDAEFGS